MMKYLQEITNIETECKNPQLIYNCYIRLNLNEKTKKSLENSYKKHIENMKNVNSDKNLLKNIIDRHIYLLTHIQRDGFYIKKSKGIATSDIIIGAGNPNPTESGFTFLSPYGIPIIPASSIKGVCLNYASRFFSIDKAMIERIFGTEKIRGEVLFFDALPENFEFKPDIANPHYSDYYSSRGIVPPADYLTPIPISFICIVKNSKFLFSMACKDNELLNTAWKILVQTLSDFGIGAKTNIGYGKFKINNH